MDTNSKPIDHDTAAFWAAIARDAAATAAELRDDGKNALSDHWADIAHLRATIALAAAAVSMATSLADICSALRDDEGNGPVHILHNMSYTLAQIARNTGAIDDAAEQAEMDRTRTAIWGG